MIRDKMILEFFKLSIKNLKHKKLRSWLTVLGVVIGVSLIVSLIFLGEGLKTAVLRQLKMFGTDLVFVLPGDESSSFFGMIGGLELRDREVDAISSVPGVELVLPMSTKSEKATLKSKGEEKTVTLSGSPWYETKLIYGESQGFTLKDGVWPEKDNTPELVLGSAIAKDRFSRSVEVGDELIFDSQKMKVVGILNATGDQGADTMVYASMENFRKISDRRGGVDEAVVKISSGYNVDLVAEDIKNQLIKERGAAEFTVMTMEKAMSIVGDILGIIQIILTGVAVVALLVGGVGIMNTMFTAILERTREIGVMKAIGGSYGKIMEIFLIESGLVGFVGGVIGLFVGVFFAKMVEWIAKSQGFKFLEVTLDFKIIILVLLGTFLFGTLAGFLPARRAAKLNPAEALRKR